MKRPNNQEELSKSIYTMAREELKDLAKLQKQANKANKSIDEMESYREALSIDTNIEVNIMLSWGGGSDGYKLYFDKEQELMSGVYWYADWGTYAENKLTKDELELVFDVYMYGDASSYFDSLNSNH